MNFYVSEKHLDKGTGGAKARQDAEAIFEKNGMKPLNVIIEHGGKGSIFKKLLWHKYIRQKWDKVFEKTNSGDTVFIQYIIIQHTVFLYKSIKKAHKDGKRIVFLVHDIDSLQSINKKNTKLIRRLRIKFEEKVLKYGDKLIVHNNKMKSMLIQKGIDENKMIVLGIFDYLMPDLDIDRLSKRILKKDQPIIISGNLRKNKATYAYYLPENINFNLYGIGYENNDSKNVNYMGAYEAEEIPYVMNGSFGLVWDGESIDTCSGKFGQYLKINNPHKTSLYLMSGIPVLIWSQAALSDFIMENKCGACIDSLTEINNVINNISDEEYSELKRNTEKISLKLRNGHFLNEAIKKALE